MSFYPPFVIVGAGLFGSVIAERLASCRVPCMIMEKRNHIGGNCASSIDEETGIEVHRYGSHIFHTSNPVVWEYLNRFTALNHYQHHVEICTKNRIYPMPISLATFNAFFQRSFTPEDAMNWIRSDQTPCIPSNLEEKAVSFIGRTLYQAFICEYTQKQWGRPPKELPPEIITRLPVRLNYNTRYFSDTWEGIPLDGYDALFRRLLSNPLITLRLNCDFMEYREEIPASARIIYTGAIDQFFNYALGRLEYRFVRFTREAFDIEDYQGNSVINYGDLQVPFTRIHEFKHYHPERAYGKKTVIFKEFSGDGSEGGEIAYPVNTHRNQVLYSRYCEHAKENPGVIFGGRLGSYRYWDMDDTIQEALRLFETRIKPMLGEQELA